MSNEPSLLILPGDEDYYDTLNNSALYLHTISEVEGKSCIGVRDGVPVAMNTREMIEYLLGGEADEQEALVELMA